ncbi:MAG: mini-ribonuclease [Clostridiales bacterium]|nr:mini-ribonuclease [Clostridiales bacterium]
MEESISLKDQINQIFGKNAADYKQYSGLTLAYIGDAVFDLIIRTLLVENGNIPVNHLHKKASRVVKAQTQAALIHAIEEDLTEQECFIYKRGRNAKSVTSAKNASIHDYRTATGLEALVGYLYLDNQMERALLLMKTGLDRIGESI